MLSDKSDNVLSPTYTASPIVVGSKILPCLSVNSTILAIKYIIISF
jgi:hypothetical protein